MAIKIISKLVTPACLIALPASTFAVNMRVAAELMNFDYKETDTSGNTINQETGFIPGLTIAGSQPYRNIENSVELSLYDGQVDYDGRTSLGQPHQTTTAETIFRLLYRLGWSPRDTKGAFYGKVYWQQWDRDIQPNNNVLGLFERYRWWTFEAGVQLPFVKEQGRNLFLELGILATNNGTIMVDLTDQGFGNHTLDLGDGYGLSGELKYEIMQANNSSFQFGVQIKSWEFGRSNSKTISNGINVNIITEPDSRTVQTTLSAGYVHRF